MASRWTPGALSHDFGGRPIAVAILDLPVPVRDEPAEVSGEVGRG